MEFRPPPFRQGPTAADYAQQWGKSLNDIGDTFVQTAQQRQQMERQAMLDRYLAAKEGRDQQQFNMDYGTPIDPNATVGMPTGQMGQSSFMPGGSQPVATGSPLIDAHKQWLASGMKRDQMQPEFYGALGKDERRIFQDRVSKENYRTPQQVQTLFPDANVKDLAENYPDGIPKEDLGYLATHQKINATMGEKNDQFYQKEWDKIDKEANPLTASGRTGLGMAARADYNANRALVTLNKPMVTNQEAANVMADIAQIYQGGSATQYGMSHQGYDSLYQKVMGATQYLTGKPQDSVPEPIKQRLLSVLNEMKATNKAVFKQQLDHIERTQPRVIGRYSNEWKALRQNMEGGVAGGPQGTQGSKPKSVIQNGHTYTLNEATGQYE